MIDSSKLKVYLDSLDDKERNIVNKIINNTTYIKTSEMIEMLNNISFA